LRVSLLVHGFTVASASKIANSLSRTTRLTA
jgi:hypothetical protein